VAHLPTRNGTLPADFTLFSHLYSPSDFAITKSPDYQILSSTE
jgi:hypothetical protein